MLDYITPPNGLRQGQLDMGVDSPASSAYHPVARAGRSVGRFMDARLRWLKTVKQFV